ncbi:MAG: tRNA (adenosine(37)-N6)-threonylcarbamoyltransferase complex ATPase subunit type 1 TsaE [Alphaproteobacteria bacterium]
MQTVYLANESETLALGERLSRSLRAGDVIALSGGLGAGKTTLSRGIIRALTGEEEVPSPTYTLVQTYEAENCELWHCDMYRLERPGDAYELGLMDAFEDAICLIEWPDKLGDLLPETARRIDVEFDGEGRKAVITGWGKDLNE